jgi:hypothetical protein
MSDDKTKRPADAQPIAPTDSEAELLYRLVRELPLAMVLRALK